MDILEQLLTETKAEPFATINGEPVYDFQNAQKMNRRELAKEKLQGRTINFDERPLTDNGLSYTHSRQYNQAINPETFTRNVYRVIDYKGKKALEIVLDYRAIKEQESNNVYTKFVNTYIIGKERNKYKLLGKSKVSDTDFVNEFINSLSVKDAVVIIETINEQGEEVKDTTSLSDLL